MYGYLALFDPGSDLPGTYKVTFPDVPEAITQGDSLADAKIMAADALETILGTYIEKGEDLPPVKTRSGKNSYWIEPSVLAQIELALYTQFRNSRISKTELANRMGIAKQQVDRLFDLKHSSRVEQLESAFRAIEKRIVISIEDLESGQMSPAASGHYELSDKLIKQVGSHPGVIFLFQRRELIEVISSPNMGKDLGRILQAPRSPRKSATHFAVERWPDEGLRKKRYAWAVENLNSLTPAAHRRVI